MQSPSQTQHRAQDAAGDTTAADDDASNRTRIYARQVDLVEREIDGLRTTPRGSSPDFEPVKNHPLSDIGAAYAVLHREAVAHVRSEEEGLAVAKHFCGPGTSRPPAVTLAGLHEVCRRLTALGDADRATAFAAIDACSSWLDANVVPS